MSTGEEVMVVKKWFHQFVRWIGDLGISPNQITVGRLFFYVPGWLLWVYRVELGQRLGVSWQLLAVVAMVVVTTVILFDLVDGALARETGQVSREGKVLDPAVDKLITYSTLGLFWKDIDHRGLLILFLLDLASTFVRGSQAQGANQFGKNKAFAQNISKAFFGLAILLAWPWLNLVGNFLIWLAVGLATISVGIRILPAGVQNSIRHLIPQCFTLSNLGGGLLAIWFANQGQIGRAVFCNFAAMACDLVDGAVARKLGVTSKFGKHFDTAADLLSFGVAPSALVLLTLPAGWPGWVKLVGVGYSLATCCRLYDYERSKDITPPGFFRGMPSPAGAWLVVSSVLWRQPLLSVGVMVVAALLMCSFKVNWIHFNRVFSSLTRLEIAATIGLAAIPLLLAALSAMAVDPACFLSGPILVYLFSPLWRKPAAVLNP